MKKIKFTKKGIQVLVIAGAVCIAGIVTMCIFLILGGRKDTVPVRAELKEPDIEEMFLTPNKYSRPGKALKTVKGIVVHYTANPGTDAEDNRSYFEGLRKSKAAYASSHFIIGLDGRIIQCIPLEEIAYASNKRNKDTISIECCHKDKSGKFTKETYDSLVELTAWLLSRYGLDAGDVIRHYDVTGKKCPLYFVEHEDKWQEFLKAVEKKLYK